MSLYPIGTPHICVAVASIAVFWLLGLLDGPVE